MIMRGKDSSKLDREGINREARGWFIDIHHGENTPDIQENFKVWLAEDDEHRKSYEDICAFMQQTQAFTSDPLCKEKYKHLASEKIAAGQPIQKALAMLKQFFQKRVQAGQKASFKSRVFYGPIALSMLLFLGAYIVFQPARRDYTYHTEIGEQKTVVLADGSTVKLNTNTRITVDFSEQNRSVILDQGQAYFIVAKERERPFMVHFDKGQVIAVGTEFEVYNKGPEVLVSLVEGKVRVLGLPAHQTASQAAQKAHVEQRDIVMVADSDTDIGAQISVSAKTLSSVIEMDNSLIIAWQDKKMIFRDKTLGYVIAEINRYSPRRIILEQAEMANTVISGIFPTQSDEALEIISNYFDLTQTVNTKGEIILTPSIL